MGRGKLRVPGHLQLSVATRIPTTWLARKYQGRVFIDVKGVEVVSMQHACLSEKFLKKRWVSSLSYINLVTNCAEWYTGSVKCRMAVNLEYSYFLNGRISILPVLLFRVVYEYVIAVLAYWYSKYIHY